VLKRHSEGENERRENRPVRVPDAPLTNCDLLPWAACSARLAAASARAPGDGRRRQCDGGQDSANLPVNIAFRGEPPASPRDPVRVDTASKSSCRGTRSSLDRVAARPHARLAAAWCKKDTGKRKSPSAARTPDRPGETRRARFLPTTKKPRTGAVRPGEPSAQFPPIIGVVQLNLKFILARTTCDLSSNVAVEAGSGPIAGCVSVVLPKSMYRYSTPSDH
jgi:hypothetical protein